MPETKHELCCGSLILSLFVETMAWLDSPLRVSAFKAAYCVINEILRHGNLESRHDLK